MTQRELTQAELSKRAHFKGKIREGWPTHGSNTYTEKRGYVDVPPVRDGGLTAALIDFAVDTILTELETSK